MAIAQQSAKKRPPLPRVGEFVRYIDPVTENTLVRLTSLASANRLSAPQNAFISTRERYLVFSSDRSGAFCPHLVDLRTGAIRQLAQTTALDPQSLMLDRGQRAIFFIDGGKLKQVQIANRRVTTITEGMTAFGGRSEAELVVVRGGNLETLGGETFISEVSGPCLVSPDGTACLVQKAAADCALWVVPIRPRGEPKLLVSGPLRFPFWSPDSRSVLFLRDVPGNGVMLSEIHRAALDGSPEEIVARTSQFASFSPNGDASVFVGASRSKAQPTVNLLLRSAKREMTLCEHRASKPQAVTPVFAPDSRRVYFESDKEGKSAVYSINVELLVEPTEF
jgi:oligogalacturonide lyase